MIYKYSDQMDFICNNKKCLMTFIKRHFCCFLNELSLKNNTCRLYIIGAF